MGIKTKYVRQEEIICFVHGRLLTFWETADTLATTCFLQENSHLYQSVNINYCESLDEEVKSRHGFPVTTGLF